MPYPYQKNDGGRAGSKRPKARNDCTVRAIAIACAIPYDEAYDLLALEGRKGGRGFQFKFWAPAATVNGRRFVWRSFPAIKGEPRMSHARFCRENPTGVYILNTAKHVAAVIDGVVQDTFTEYDGRCIYGAWEVCPASVDTVEERQYG